MNRIDEINNFLKLWVKIYTQYPNYEIDYSTIYVSLMEYGLTEQEKNNNDIEYLFSNWIKQFKNNPALNVYHTDLQPLFLQFRSNGNMGRQHIKLYLSYPSDKIEHCVNKIFTFIADNKIPNSSKVAKNIRSDSVVLRIINYDDAVKVANYINSDSELSMYAKPTNPFMMRNGCVGVSYDDLISYNQTLAKMLRYYLDDCQKNNTLNNVNARNFQIYIQNFRQNMFHDNNHLRQFLNMFKVDDMLQRFSSVDECLLNYEQVLRLICLQLDETMDMDYYHSFYNDVKDKEKNLKLRKYYTQLLQNSDLENTIPLDEINLLNEYIKYAKEKYQNPKIIVSQLRNYVNSNDVNHITRDHNFRQRFIQHLSPSKILIITNNNIEQYIESILINKKSKQQSQENINQLYRIFTEACIATYHKYGKAQLQEAIANGLNGNYNFFTNGNSNYRNILQNITPELFATFCNKFLSCYNLEGSRDIPLSNHYINASKKHDNEDSNKSL